MVQLKYWGQDSMLRAGGGSSVTLFFCDLASLWWDCFVVPPRNDALINRHCESRQYNV